MKMNIYPSPNYIQDLAMSVVCEDLVPYIISSQGREN